MAKRKILLLSDDLRMHSGVATMSRELVIGTVKRYDWVQMAGAISHPDKGKVINMDAATAQVSGVPDAKVVLYPVDGYGNEELLFNIIEREKPDALMHFTDPRFWGWLYAIERQIRAKIPLCYLDIWDDIPFPMYNRPYYESCDLLMAISKQTDNINKWVLGPDKCFTLDGEFDKGGKLIITQKYIIEAIQKINKIILEMPELDVNRPCKDISDPRIIMFHKIFVDLLSSELHGKIGKNGLINRDEVIYILEKIWENDTYPSIKKSLEEDINFNPFNITTSIENNIAGSITPLYPK